jgi:hypothetical protein
MSMIRSVGRRARALFATLLALHLLVLGGPASAATFGVDSYLAAEERQATVDRVRDFLAEDRVRAQLEHLGVDAGDASERVASLTDAELLELDARMEELPAGGDVIAVVGIVFVVLLVLELLGVTNVFTAI